MKRGQTHIPKSELDKHIAKVSQIKTEMTGLLCELEEKATGKKIKQPGKWRHDTKKWAKEHNFDLG